MVPREVFMIDVQGSQRVNPTGEKGAGVPSRRCRKRRTATTDFDLKRLQRPVSPILEPPHIRLQPPEQLWADLRLNPNARFAKVHSGKEAGHKISMGITLQIGRRYAFGLEVQLEGGALTRLPDNVGHNPGTSTFFSFNSSQVLDTHNSFL